MRAHARHSRSPAAIAGWVPILAAATLAPGCRALHGKHAVAESRARCQHFSREGAAAMELGQWGQAESLLRQALGASPSDACTRVQLAETLWTRGRRDEAIDHIRSATAIDPNDAAAAVRHGEMLLAIGRPAAASAEADRALAVDRGLASAWALRGRAHREMGAQDRAMADLHQALRLDPRARATLADLAALYHATGRRRRELTTLHRLRATYVPGEEPRQLLAGEAEAYLALGRPRQAAEQLRLACGRGEPNAALLGLLAQAEEAAGESVLAKQAAERALALDAGHGPAREVAARLRQQAVR